MTYEEWRSADGPRVLEALQVSKQLLPAPTVERQFLRRDQIGGQNVEISKIGLSYDSELISDPDQELGFLKVVPVNGSSQGTVVALHGHEEPYRGAIPEEMMDNSHWTIKFVARGYTVILPSHLFYEHAERMYASVPHHFLWTRFVNDVLENERSAGDLAKPVFAAGVSSGCTTASLITVIQPEVEAFSGAGCALPLNWLRENYRIEGHPNQWDYPDFESELPIFALAVDKRFQFQVGKLDAFFPNGQALTDSVGEYVSPRDVFLTDIAGVYLALQQVFRKADAGGEVEVLVTSLGHTIDPWVALDFFEAEPGQLMPAPCGRSMEEDC